MAKLTRWNPRNELEMADPFRSMETMLEEIWRNWPLRTSDRAAGFLRPAMDVIENENNVEIRIDLPGMKPEDVQVEIENQTLTISGEMGDTVERDGDRYHYRERSYGSFQRSLRLPNTLDAENIDARFENGVLSIAIPKQPQAKPKQITVKSANGKN